MSKRSVTSFMRLEVSCVPLSVRRTLGTYECLRKMVVSASTIALAVIRLKGTAKRYLVKTSIAVITCVNPFAG